MGVEFRYDQERAWNAVLWFLHQHGGALDFLKLIKLAFFADRLHLAKYEDVRFSAGSILP